MMKTLKNEYDTHIDNIRKAGIPLYARGNELTDDKDDKAKKEGRNKLGLGKWTGKKEYGGRA